MKETLIKFMNNSLKTVKVHSPEILTGIGAAGVITTALLSFHTANAVNEALCDYIEESGDHDPSKKTIIKVTWRHYIPMVISSGISIACIIGAHMRHEKAKAALMALYLASEESLHDYKEEVKKLLSSTKAEKAEQDAKTAQLDRYPVASNEVIILSGDTLCFDSFSKRYFKSDIETLKKIQNDINQDILTGLDGWACLNEYYNAVGLPEIDFGNEIGWDALALLDLDFSSKINEEGDPCIVISFQVAPFVQGYSR